MSVAPKWLKLAITALASEPQDAVAAAGRKDAVEFPFSGNVTVKACVSAVAKHTSGGLE